MKKLILLFCSMVFFVVIYANSNARSLMYSTVIEDTIQIWTSPELFEIANTWASTFEKNNPEMKFDISKVPASEVSNMIQKSENIGFVTNSYISDAISYSTWKMAVGRDIIVPIMSMENPFRDQIFKRGISPDEFAAIYNNEETINWGTLLSNEQSVNISFFHNIDEINKPHFIDFLHADENRIDKNNIPEINEMLNKIKLDKYSVGFCRLADVIDDESQEIKEGLSFIPIDINGNEKVDFVEDIYNTLSELERGVWIGKYPKTLYSNLYTIANNQPIKNNETEFLKWIITEGQKDLLSDGYSSLVTSESQSNIRKLSDNPEMLADVSKPNESYYSWIALILIIAIVIVPVLVFTTRSKIPTDVGNNKKASEFFTKSSVLAPKGLFFDTSHTWTFMEKEGDIRIGISDFLQRVTGRITKVHTKNPGDVVKKGETFLTIIQDGKQLNISSPVSGLIKKTNEQLNNNTSVINSSPYSEGWIYLIESVNWLNEIKYYFVGETYKNWLSKEFDRLKDFFSSSIQLDVNNRLEKVIQDGGELSFNPLENFGPIVWEEFQSAFINREK